jgi:hypothetical protein
LGLKGAERDQTIPRVHSHVFSLGDLDAVIAEICTSDEYRAPVDSYVQYLVFAVPREANAKVVIRDSRRVFSDEISCRQHAS